MPNININDYLCCGWRCFRWKLYLDMLSHFRWPCGHGHRKDTSCMKLYILFKFQFNLITHCFCKTCAWKLLQEILPFFSNSRCAQFCLICKFHVMKIKKLSIFIYWYWLQAKCDNQLSVSFWRLAPCQTSNGPPSPGCLSLSNSYVIYMWEPSAGYPTKSLIKLTIPGIVSYRAVFGISQDVCLQSFRDFSWKRYMLHPVFWNLVMLGDL